MKNIGLNSRLIFRKIKSVAEVNGKYVVTLECWHTKEYDKKDGKPRGVLVCEQCEK